MAHKVYISDEELKTMLNGVSHVWGTSLGVGWGYDNYSDDVMLVQYLLNSTTDAALAVDGLFGKKTQKAIRMFQKLWGGRCVVDGKVNSVDGSTVWVGDSSFAYTLYYLNAEYMGQKPLFYMDLKMDPKLPSELCQAFKAYNHVIW